MHFREVSGLVLYDKDKKILLQHRTEDASRWPGYWGLFGGGLEGDEDPEQALRREIVEELEYTVRAPFLLFTKEYDQDDVHFKIHLFIEPYDSSQLLVLHEGQAMGWFSIDEALKLKTTEQRMKDFVEIGRYLDAL